MHSSTFSFDRAGFVRQTASDRPGVAQPVPVRDIPPQPWNRIFMMAVVVTLMLVGAWEYTWRVYGVAPGYHNSNGQWAQQRRRIDTGEGGKTVLIGSSRVLFDVQLPVWEKITGQRPIQLAMEGTSSVPMLEDLAADPNFTGNLLVGVAPDLFFGGFAYRGDVVPYYHKESPSQRSGNWLSMHVLEPYLAFYDEDFALPTVIKRQNWPERPGVKTGACRVRKLRVSEAKTAIPGCGASSKSTRNTGRYAGRFGRSISMRQRPGMETPDKSRKGHRYPNRQGSQSGGDATGTRCEGAICAAAQHRRILCL